MTPAIASEPYCAAAPSRSTSMRPMAGAEIWERSGPCAPALSAPAATCTSAERCMRLPLMSTRIWSAGRPRSVGGRTKAEASPRRLRCWLNEGTSVCRIVWSCGAGWALKSSALNTSTGTALSSTVRSLRRVPVTTMLVVSLFSPASSCGSGSAGAACASAAGAARPVMARANADAVTRKAIWPAQVRMVMRTPCWLRCAPDFSADADWSCLLQAPSGHRVPWGQGKTTQGAATEYAIRAEK